MDRIRELLFETEEAESNQFRLNEKSAFDRYQIELMEEADLVQISLFKFGGESSENMLPGGVTYGDLGFRLTWSGHGYLDAVGSDTVWNKTKVGAKQLGGATFGVMKDIAIANIKQEVSEKLGMKI